MAGGVEISRLIGRSLRQAVDLKRMGEYTITVDCDVLEADGGTRTAAITGGFVALALAVCWMIDRKMLKESPIHHQVAAVSCGVVRDQPLLDLCYEEDSQAEADMNFVLNERGDIIEIMGVRIPKLVIPVKPGRNLAIIIEIAARNLSLRRMGYSAAQELDKRLNEMVTQEADKA
jgi:ribonuclease PH